MRGSESNHTLVTLNGIPINDQSTTNGLHDFGLRFIQTIHQVEVYKGSNGAILDQMLRWCHKFCNRRYYTNSFSVSGFNYDNNSANYNTTKITENGWHLNFKGAANQSKTDSAIAKGHESDGTKNYQVNLNGNKWLNDNLKLKSTFYYRDTKSDYDSSASKEDPVFADNKMYTIQTGIERKTKSSLDNLMFHYHNYDRKYYVQGKKDKYYSESLVAKAEREVDLIVNFHMVLEVNINMTGAIILQKHFHQIWEDMLKILVFLLIRDTSLTKIKFYRFMVEMMTIKKLVEIKLTG